MEKVAWVSSIIAGVSIGKTVQRELVREELV